MNNVPADETGVCYRLHSTTIDITCTRSAATYTHDVTQAL